MPAPQLPHPTLHALLSAQENFDALLRRPSWQSLAYAAGWQDYATLPAGLWRHPLGIVVMRGVATKTSAWSTVFPGDLICTLPFAPLQREPMLRNVSSTSGNVDIYPNGEVRLTAAPAWVSTSASYVAFGGLMFWAEG